MTSAEVITPSWHNTYRRVAGIWDGVLSPCASASLRQGKFFELGGTSMMAMDLLERLEAEFGVDISILVFGEHSSLDALTTFLHEWRGEPDAAGAEPDRSAPGARVCWPTSASQQELFGLAKMNPRGQLAYNECVAWHVTGQVSVRALRESVEAVVSRHPALRTLFEAGGAQQRVDPEAKANWCEWPAVASPPSLDDALEALSSVRAQPFDLERGPLHRLYFLALVDGSCLVALAANHIIIDGESFALFQRELAASYSSILTGQPSGLREPLAFGTYIERQLERAMDGSLERSRTYWREVFESGVGQIEMALDQPRSEPRQFRGDWATAECDVGATWALRDLARQHDASLASALFTAYLITLARWSRQDSGLVGLGAANRTIAGSDVMIGFAANPLPIRFATKAESTFTQTLAATRLTMLEALSHQAIPIASVRASLETRRAGHSVGFEMATAYAALSGPGVRFEALPVRSGHAAFDMKLMALERDAELHFILEFDAEVLRRATAERFLRSFVQVIQQVVTQPDAAIARLRLVSAAEEERMLVTWNSTARTLPSASVPELVAMRCRETPRAPAVSDGVEHLDYGELWLRALRIATDLRALGVGPGSVVAVHVRRSVAYVEATLAVLLVRAAYLPLEVEHPVERLRVIVADARAQAVVHDGDTPLLGCRTVRVDGSDSQALSRQRPDSHFEPPTPEDAAYVIYTSGSTGTPKGVVISHRALRNLIYSHREVSGLHSGDRVAQLTSVAFDPAVEEIWPALCTGASIHIAPTAIRRDPAQIQAWLIQQRVSLAIVPTPMAVLLFGLHWPEPVALSRMLIGGERLGSYPSPRLPFRVINCYGPTEATVWATAGVLTPGAIGVPSIGSPALNTRVYVLSREGNLVPVGAPGELCIAGDAVGSGYLHQKELSRLSFVPDPFAATPGRTMFRTGDLVRRHADGSLEFLGRIDEQVKLRGFRLEPGDVEAALQKAGSFRELAVTVREPSAEVRVLVATVVPSAESACDFDQLRRRLRAVLPDYMIPQAFEIMKQLPRGANGKVDRSALRTRAVPREDRGERVGARDALELALAAQMSATVGLPDVTLDDDFFSIGGDSLRAVHLAANLRKAHGIELGLAALAEHRTVRQLARALRQGLALSSPFVTLRNAGQGTLLLFHPIGGNVLCYVPLAASMPGGPKIVAVQCPAVYDSDFAFSSFEQLASSYVDAMPTRGLEEPFVFAGYCAGGVVAHAVAREYERRGQSSAGLILIDSALPSGAVVTRDEPQLMDFFYGELSILQQGRRVQTIEPGLRSVPEGQRLSALLAIAREHGVLPADMLEADVARLLRSCTLSIEAYHRYRPGALRCLAVMLQAGEVAPMLADTPSYLSAGLGWVEHVPALELRRVAGDHYTMMREPHLVELSNQVARTWEQLVRPTQSAQK